MVVQKKESTQLGNGHVSDTESQNVWTISDVNRVEKIYTYNEALELAGHGLYNIGLLFTLILGMHALAMEIFGFSIVVRGATCDFKLHQSQKSILLAMPYLGSIFMSYPWGYIADTQGRRRGLIIALWGSFIAAVVSAFSVNWITLAVLKFISSSFSSGIQSLAYTLLGESCAERYKNRYLVILTSSLMTSFCIYMVYGFFVLRLTFSLDMGLITFTPWRLLTLILASPLGATLLLVSLFHESPKYLLNAGFHDKALGILKKIHRTNGKCNYEYSVKKIVVNETGAKIRNVDVSLMKSLKDQTVPLFKPPILYRTLQLFYLTVVIYSPSNGLISWLPFLAESFSTNWGSSSSNNETQDFCSMIVTSQNVQEVAGVESCLSSINIESVWISLIHGISFTTACLIMAMVANRKRMLLIVIFIVSGGSGLISVNVTDKIASIIFFFGMILDCLGIAIVFSYFVDLYPTSYRGMASCLGVMVARAAAVAGVSLIGKYMFSHCTESMFVWSIIILSGVVASIFLPPDKIEKE
ncbi:unnamed protein product [Parnassius apollo]|uniref:(apollo) hypothetical protein n=1 Tax=Parnassius apollo TaxID=110799 RepID=A0A8S3XMJ3_PARAO|nr:unnamed protein product [Parnassius apollo]